MIGGTTVFFAFGQEKYIFCQLIGVFNGNIYHWYIYFKLSDSTKLVAHYKLINFDKQIFEKSSGTPKKAKNMQIMYKNDKPKPLKSVLVCSNEFIPEGICLTEKMWPKFWKSVQIWEIYDFFHSVAVICSQYLGVWHRCLDLVWVSHLSVHFH